MPELPLAGSVRLTGDSTVGASGKPIHVFSIYLRDGGGGAGEIVLRNGTDATGDIWFQVAGSGASIGEIIDIGIGGITFPDGCFYDHDTNNDFVVITYTQPY